MNKPIRPKNLKVGDIFATQSNTIYNYLVIKTQSVKKTKTIFYKLKGTSSIYAHEVSDNWCKICLVFRKNDEVDDTGMDFL